MGSASVHEAEPRARHVTMLLSRGRGVLLWYLEAAVIDVESERGLCLVQKFGERGGRDPPALVVVVVWS